MAEYAEWIENEGHEFRRWDQAYFVLTLCRLLYTAATGGVAGKAQAAEWATRELDPHWRRLVERAIGARNDPNLEGRFPADAAAMDEARAFARFASRALAQPGGGPSRART